MDKERRAFEEWAKHTLGYVQEALDIHWQDWSNEYTNHEFQKRWLAWQAATLAAKQGDVGAADA